MYWFDGAYEAVSRFMEMGGDVLWLIAALLFCMWTLIFERVWYFRTGWRQDSAAVIRQWEARTERRSWAAHRVREKLVSESKLLINEHLSLIKAMVALCPLLGLLGTVTGMIEVFNIMAVTGGGDAKSNDGRDGRCTVRRIRQYLPQPDRDARERTTRRPPDHRPLR
jgi:biopolymer transport protein ExbB